MSTLATRLVPPPTRRKIGALAPSRRSIVLGALLAGLVSVTCALPNVPPQPDSGLRQDYAGPAPLLRSLTVANAPNARLNVYADGMVALSHLPWFHQGNDRTCAQANIATLLSYWGRPVPYPTVVKEMNPGNWPTDVVTVSDYLRKRGLQAQDYRLTTLNFLKAKINAGRPVLVLLDFGSLASTHYVTVKGYNEQQDILLISDPIDGPNQLMSYTQFQELWLNRSLSRIPGLQNKYTRIAFDVGL